jgi:hypothetical protein
MKKLAVVLAVVVSGFVNGQTVKEIEQYKKECNCNEKLAVEIHNSVNEINSWTDKTHTFKTGDNDRAETIGILKDIFTDPTAKLKYAKINPRIAQLQVNGFSFGDTISYSKWIASIPIYDTTKYELIYTNYNTGIVNRYNESIAVYERNTDKFIRKIFIIYTDNNFRIITDSNVK